MSDLFESRLAEHFGEFLKTRPPQGGQIYLAEFHSKSITDRFANALVSAIGDPGPPLEVNGSNVELPAYYHEEGVPMYLVRVKPEIIDDQPREHVVVQGFATKMRNLISQSANSDDPRAMLMVLDSESTLDTLDASEELLSDDGPVNLESFRDSLLDPTTCDQPQGRGLLRGLNAAMGRDAIYAEDTQALETLCQIRASIDDGRYSDLPELIGELPQYIREDFFTAEEFSREQDEDSLAEAVEETLNDNSHHAETLRRAHRAGTDTESRLASNYERPFVNKVLELPDWSEASHAEARKHEREDLIRRYQDLEIGARRQRIYKPLEDTSKTRLAVVLIPDDGTVELTAIFSGDLEDTPHEVIGPDGEPVGQANKRENRVKATLEGIDPSRPEFARFQFYVGKKTTQGKPTHQFDIATVPEWFYHATEGVSLDIDVEEETFLVPDQTIDLTPPERIDFDFEPKTVDVVEDGQIIEFKGPLTLDPDPPEVLERIGCLIAPPDEVPIELTFLLEATAAETEKVTLPLMLSAIVEPATWAGEDFLLPEVLSIDTSRGEIYGTAEQGVRLEDEALELLQIEEHIINERTARGRIVEGDSLDFGHVPKDSEQLPSALSDAYGALFDHFDERGRTPSTDPWDTETQHLVRSVLDEYERAVQDVDSPKTFRPYGKFRDLGVIKSDSTDKVWLTPFNPVLLAYGLRIVTWRDETLTGNADKGFRRDESVAKFNAAGLLPYRSVEDDNELLRGMRFRENPLWQIYSPVSSPGAVTPDYMDRVMRDKLYTFVRAFPILFSLHPDRQLVINMVNLGDLDPVVRGLYLFYDKLDGTEFEPPPILLRIYGDPDEGDALERFFTATAESSLRTTLEKRNDELVDLLRKQVSYVHAGEYVEENQKPAHLTFFRGLLREKSGIMTSLGELPSGTLNEGLFPRESIDVDATSGETVYTVGFSCDENENDTIHRVAKVANALEAGLRQDSYQYGTAVKKNVVPTKGANLRKLWDDSLWAVHVQPNVGIEFYLNPETELQSGSGQLMIHYSDQYDSSSPNYDVITSTNKREPFLISLQQAIEDANLSQQLDPELVLSTLVAIDGELALKLQRSNETEVIEFVGFVGGLALSKKLLERTTTDHVWVPISLNELTRHDRAYRGAGSGVIQWDPEGKASDDLCFVGLPTDAADTSLKLWLVETKGGSAKVSTGREQVVGALENMQKWFTPEASHTDAEILYSEFGKIVLDVARRMFNYNVMSEDEYGAVMNRERGLREGAFDISFLRDANGHVGEVIRIRPNSLVSKYSSDGSVRAIEAPLAALELLSDATIEETLRDLDVDQLAFDLEAEMGVDGAKSIPTQAPGGPETSVEAAGSSGGSEETPTSHQMDGALTDGSPGEQAPSAAEESDDNVEGPKEPGEGVETAAGDEGDDPEVEETASTADSPKDTPPDDAGKETTPEPEVGAGESNPPHRFEALIENLTPSPVPEAEVNPAELAGDLKKAFDSLDIDVHPPNPSSVSVGPRKVGVDVLPKEGQKVEAILRNLDTLSVHIQSHGDIVGTRAPAKGAVHLEIPHGDPRDVYLREGLEGLRDELDEPLTIPLGVDTDNRHHALSLVNERHALIGGATGSGKSNFLGTVISSLAITHSPDQVTISILDPKGVDFGRFQDLPHVQPGGYFDTTSASTEHLLDIVEEEVPRRQQILKDAGVASISELNEHAEELGVDRLPYHVIVIDEYADLIMSLDDQEGFEESVTRLAQIGRALGIVVLLATQRPSADIVSGKIKTNFPCRISFRLPSNTDSRVILDQPGAEDLEGSGDMIVISQSGDRYNLQGYYLPPMDAKSIIERLSADPG